MRRFSYENAGDMWQADALHGPRVGVGDGSGRRRKTYLLAIMDDATRVVPYAAFAFSESAASFQLVLREGIERRGVPKRLYCDNGSSFRNRHLELACARLDIALIHARPYHAAGKGKIERFFRTVRGQVLNHLEEADLKDLEALNRRFRSWVEVEYHNSPHRGLDNRTPFDEWALRGAGVRFPGPGVDLADLFLFEETRRVDKAATVSLHNRRYEVDPALRGRKVVLRYDPGAPPGRPLLVVHDGRPAGAATPLDLHANARVRRGVRFRALGGIDGEDL